MKLMGGILSMALTCGVAAQGEFQDHGVAARVAEVRGLIATTTKGGRNLAIVIPSDQGARPYILVADIDTGRVEQHFCPEGVRQNAPFCGLVSRAGRFYTAHGPVLLEFDLDAGTWTFHGTPSKDVSVYLCIDEGRDGTIWLGGYPQTTLVSFDAVKKVTKDHGRMDPKEMYLSFLANDDAGWIYSGIGTARRQIAAYHPQTGEKRLLIAEADRGHGTASVYSGKDGSAGGHDGQRRVRLRDGVMGPAKKAGPARMPTRAVKYGGRLADFVDGRRVVSCDLWRGELAVGEADRKRTRTISFEFKNEGSTITSVGTGPDGLFYASTCHPMHLTVLDPEKGQMQDFGPVPLIGGGNFCAITNLGAWVIGAEYSGGRLWAYDPTKAWQPQTGAKTAKKAANPRVLAQWARDVCRPRTVLALPDGDRVAMAGFAGYGLVGGGIGIYNVRTREATLLAADADLLPGHSCITLKALPNGDLVGGTSVGAPGGGHATAKEAELFVLDAKTRKVSFRTAPVAGDGNIVSIDVARNGLVFGLSGNATLFVFDPKTKDVVHRQSLSSHGSVPRHAFQQDGKGRLIAMLSRDILEVDPQTYATTALATSPAGITAGGAFSKGRVCFASGSHLWTWRVPAAE